jgi:hypothetical protein
MFVTQSHTDMAKQMTPICIHERMKQFKAHFYMIPKITLVIMRAKFFAGGKVITIVTRIKPKLIL